MARVTEHVPVFVAGPPMASDGAFVCYECLAKDERRRLGDDDVELWQEFSSGWTGPCVCERCRLSIPVYVDGATT